MPAKNATGERLRTFLLFVLLIGASGTGTELLLLGHYEDWWQRIPLVGLGVSVALTVWILVRPSARAIKALQVLGILFLATGAVGFGLHFKGNVEFELELHSSTSGLVLVWEALRGAFPALAPGAMAQLGLLGLAACYRHPLLPRGNREEED